MLSRGFFLPGNGNTINSFVNIVCLLKAICKNIANNELNKNQVTLRNESSSVVELRQ